MSADADRLRRESQELRRQGRAQSVAAEALRDRADGTVADAEARAERITDEARLLADNLVEHAEALELRADEYERQADGLSIDAARLDNAEESEL